MLTCNLCGKLHRRRHNITFDGVSRHYCCTPCFVMFMRGDLSAYDLRPSFWQRLKHRLRSMRKTN